VVQFILWAVIIMVLLFIVYKLFVSQGLFTKNKTDAVVKESGEISKEMTDPADYDAMIRQSYTKGDYRMAVRFLFLKTLRLLAERGYIQYETDKTNYRYVQEIKADKKQSFASLVLDYEYVWYGHIDLVKDQYEQVEKKYQSFLNKV
jgi:nitrogen fixation/metabolism regulation signal transduction histidine kinase